MDYLTLTIAFLAIVILRRFMRSFFPVYILPEKRAILITGCDTGFGYHLALRAKKSGFRVFACCFSKTSDGASALEKAGCVILEMDVTKQDMIDAAAAAVEEQLKQEGLLLHGIVNNAGVNVTSGPMEWNTPEMVDKVLNVNTMGVVRVTRSFLPFIRAAKGRVVNVCSMAAHVAAPRMVSYCMSKTATLVFSNGLRRELKNMGVKVSTISPWFYSTNIVEDSNVRRYALNSWEGATPEARKAYGSPDSFDEYYGKMPKKIPNLRHDINEVIDCMIDALTNEEPKADYIPDVGSRIMACILETLPTYWVDSALTLRRKAGLGI